MVADADHGYHLQSQQSRHSITQCGGGSYRYSTASQHQGGDIFDQGFRQGDYKFTRQTPQHHPQLALNTDMDSLNLERGRSTKDLRRRTHTGVGGSSKQRNNSCHAKIVAHQSQRQIEDCTRGAPTPSKSIRSGRKHSVPRHQDLMEDDEVEHQHQHNYSTPYPQERSTRRRSGNLFTPATGRPRSTGRRSIGGRLSTFAREAVNKLTDFSSPWTGYSSKAASRIDEDEDDSDCYSPEHEARGRKQAPRSGRRPHRDSVASIDTPYESKRNRHRSNEDVSRYHRESPYMDHAARLPMIVSRYSLLFLNFFVVFACAYAIYTFYTTIHNDIETKVNLHKEEILEEITRCQRDYRENRCDPTIRVPAMEEACREWEACMNRDPYAVARRAKFSGETLGEAINAFFEALTWKAVICMSLLFFGTVFTYNLCFWLFSRRLDQQTPVFQHYPQHDAYAPPPTTAKKNYEDERWRGEQRYGSTTTPRRYRNR